MADLVLALNAGSSTVKFALFELGAGEPQLRFRGLIDSLGQAPRLKARTAAGQLVTDLSFAGPVPRRPESFADDILVWCAGRMRADDRLSAFSHRICHGGPDFAEPALLTADVLRRLEALAPLAPLHQPHNLAMARAAAARRPDLPNVGCFDTAFGRALPEAARTIPLPAVWRARGVRRYGFHGLSYAYLQQRLQALAGGVRPRRAVLAHLGSGASLCACLDGAPVDTTMGFSPLDGLVMSTRCGGLDPGVSLYLLDQGLAPSELQDLFYRRSGLLAVSGLSGDMRALLASATAEAAAAVDLFVHRTVRELGGLVASLGGLDALVFSAGIGENAPEIRRRICERLPWLGLALDPGANAEGRVRIDAPGSAVSVWVIPTDEERMLACGAQAFAPA